MRTVPIILFVAVAGFHSVISAPLESVESNESSEETVSEEPITPQEQASVSTEELKYEAAHVKDEESLGVTRVGAEVLNEEDTDDDEKEALTGTTHQKEENSRSDESVDTDSVGYSFEQTAVLGHNESYRVTESVEENSREDEDADYYDLPSQV